MYGGRFGGGGASGGWSGWNRGGRRTSSAPWRRRGGSAGRGRRFGSRGGNISWLTSITITGETDETTAICAAIPFIHSGYWLDQQLRQNSTTPGDVVSQWEGELDAVRVVHARLKIHVWSSSYIAATPVTQLLAPHHVAFCIIPAYDAAGVGDPNDFAPIQIPNLFVRDWGHIARQQISPDPTNLYPDEYYRAQRTLFRDSGFTDHSSLDVANVGSDNVNVYRHVISKPFTLRRSDLLCFVFCAYNTYPDDVTVGLRVTGSFGYRHYRRT